MLSGSGDLSLNLSPVEIDPSLAEIGFEEEDSRVGLFRRISVHQVPYLLREQRRAALWHLEMQVDECLDIDPDPQNDFNSVLPVPDSTWQRPTWPSREQRRRCRNWATLLSGTLRC